MSELTQRFFETLLRTQFQSPERTLEYQRRLIERLIRHARTTVPFYRDSGRLDALFDKDDRIDWGRWGEVPVLTRSVAQANSDRLYAEIDAGRLRRNSHRHHLRFDGSAARIPHQYDPGGGQYRGAGARLCVGRSAR